jgi:hypothetical protein
VVGVGVVTSGGTTTTTEYDATTAAGSLGAAAGRDLGTAAPTERVIEASRDHDRTAVAALIAPTVTGRLWTTAVLDLRVAPTQQARVVGEIDELTRVRVTGERSAGFAQVVIRHDGAPTVAWVTAEYLVAKKPADPAETTDPVAPGLSDAPCPDSSVERGLTSRAVKVYRSVCHAFPQVGSYGGWDNHGEHASGRALDIMTSDVGLGNDIADFLRAHASELDVFDVIWRQRIWTSQRAGDGWRSMPDRGSATANHMDHVHVAVY